MSFRPWESGHWGGIIAREILDVLLSIRRLGIEETARRCWQYLSQIFQFAIVRGWVERKPAADLQGIPELRKTSQVRRQRAVKTPSELGHLFLDIETISDTMAGKTLELAGARWVEIDMASSLWRIPAERIKAKGEHIVPLARQVKERLEALYELTGGGPCLFPGFKGGQAPMRPDILRMALIRMGCGPGELVSHTTRSFKSCASTFLWEQDYNPAWIEIQLTHGERKKVIADYNPTDYITQRQDMMQYLDSLIEAARAR